MPLIEDVALTTANVMLATATAPTIIDSEAKVPRWQSALTIVAMLLVTWANWSLGVKMSATLALLTAIGWCYIFVWRAAEP